MWLKAGASDGPAVGTGWSPSGGSCGLMNGSKGARKAVLRSPKCRRSAVELAAATRAFFSGGSSSLTGSNLARKAWSGRVSGLRAQSMASDESVLVNVWGYLNFGDKQH